MRAKPGRQNAAKPSGATGGHNTAPASAYVLQHLQVFLYSLGQMSRSPWSTFMTAAVIGIALALPAALHVALQNAKDIGAAWDSGTQVSLFLRPEVSDQQAAQLAERVRSWSGIGAVDIITHAEALAEFRQLSGFGAALNILDENPLPAVLVIRPQGNQFEVGFTEELIARLRALPEVEIAEFDMQWLKRLYAIMALAQRGVLILGALLGLAVLLIVGNTIRLMIHSRRDEIEIMKLIGATDAFVRRPFLYSGLWYGLLGAIIAWLMVNVSLWLLHEPVRQLAVLYHNTHFELAGLNTQTTLALLGIGIVLGLMGSLFAVKRHLAAIEP